MSLRHSSGRNREDRSRSPVDQHHHQHRLRSPPNQHHQKNKHVKYQTERSSCEVDMRRVKQEPEDESGRVRLGDRHASASPPTRRVRADRHAPEQGRNELREQREERRRNDIQRIHHRAERSSNNEEWGPEHRQDSASGGGRGRGGGGKKAVKKEKEKPSLALSGHLTEDTNTFRGVVVKYNEPPEARRPKKRWRFYPFKGEEQLPVLHLHRQSAFLMGRDRRVADIPIDHPSCSKQHAAFQFRLVDYTRADGRRGRRVRPYIIDLGSANGTYVNNQRIEAQRYVELLEKDVVKFGFSSREYVLLHDSSDTSELEDDEGVGDGEAAVD